MISDMAEALERYWRLGQSLSIWKDGKVITLTADQIGVKQRNAKFTVAVALKP